MEREFINLKYFDSKWVKDYSDEQLKDLQNEILNNPKIGDVIQGTNGIRKFRFKIPGRGKRGSLRIIYMDLEKDSEVYLITYIEKTKKDNLTKQERNMLGKLAKTLKEEV